MLDDTTLDLFGRMPRGVGTPSRWQINSIDELEAFINHNNGINNCFVDCYPANKVIDKIFIDCDYGENVLSDTQDIARFWYEKKGWDYVPLATAKKGYHLHLRLKPKFYGLQSKLLLTKATYSVIKSVFGEFKSDRISLGGKKVRVLRNKDRVIAPDPKIIGDINRLARLPNTLRPSNGYDNNSFYCTYLPPDEFLDMTESQIYKHIKSKHKYHYNFNPDDSPMLTDFDYDFNKDMDFDDWECFASKDGKGCIESTDLNIFLDGLLRPCLYHNIITVHPDNEVRGACAIDLLRAKYSPSSILKIFSQLGWEDFDEEKTIYKIKSFIKEDNTIYKSYSCSKLRELKIPTICCVY